MVYNPNEQYSRTDLAVKLQCKLLESGFERDKTLERGPEHIREHVYARKVNADIYVAVYTSCSGHRGIISARNKGKDAIRVTTVYKTKDGRQRGLGKQRRVFRTGKIDDIVERTVERAREAWKVGLSPKTCQACGAPKFVSKQGNHVCAEACWTKNYTKGV